MFFLYANTIFATFHLQAHVKLEEEVARYIETVKRTTDDKMKLAILTDRENRQQQQIFG